VEAEQTVVLLWFSVQKRLGGGVFGDTYAAQWKGRRVAAKRIMVGVHQTEITSSNCDWIVNNVAILRCLIHSPPYVYNRLGVIRLYDLNDYSLPTAFPRTGSWTVYKYAPIHLSIPALYKSLTYLLTSLSIRPFRIQAEGRIRCDQTCL